MATERRFEILVVGAGPAGIAAACAAAESGRRVGMVDDNPSVGGQIWRGGSDSSRSARWLARFARSKCELIAGTQVIAQPERGVLLAESDDTAFTLGYEKLILATGARERFLPFPGWTLPNVLGAGGLQSIVKGGLPINGKRVIVAGSGPLLLAVAAYLRERGALVPLIAEQTSRSRLISFGLRLTPGKLLQALALRSALSETRYVTDCWPISAEGDERLHAVVLRRGHETWREPCDYLACGFGLIPNLELPLLRGCALRGGLVAVNQWQETSVAGVYCAGEPTGIGGVDLALSGGQIAGYAAAGRPENARRHFAARGRALRFQSALEHAFALREELKALTTASTMVCRCEDVPFGRIRSHHSWRSAKLHTRCGMGACQGRICGPAIEFLLGWQPESVRPPIFPARLDRLAGL